MVIRTPYGGGVRGGHYHSQSPEAYFVHTPGLKVVIPSTPADAKGLLIAAIRDPDPVIFLEPKRLYRSLKADVPENGHMVPLGKARVTLEGTDVSLFAYGSMVHECLKAAKTARERDIHAEVIDIRTLLPFDIDTILESVKKTGRAVIIHEAPKTGGFGAEIAAQLAERAIDYLRAPIIRVAGPDTPFPYTLEREYLPDAERILKGIERVMGYE
jgi:2-oxoisovalerate dehydrogenase E1 component beta subunit